MANYQMRKMPKLNGVKEDVVYPKLLISEVATLEHFALEMQSSTSFTVADIKGMMSGLAEFLARKTAQGCSVNLENIGVFTAKLAFKQTDEADEAQADVKRNARTIQVGGMNFRASKQLLRMAQEHCHLVRKKRQELAPPLSTIEERFQAAREAIMRDGFLKVKDYARLTALSNYQAAKELRQFKAQGKMLTKGLRPHIVYLLP